MIGDKRKVTTVQVRMKAFHPKNQGESFFLDLGVILLTTRESAGCKSHRAFTSIWEDMGNYSTKAIR